jgi:two-component system, response regulator
MNLTKPPKADAPLLVVEDDTDDLFVLRYALRKVVGARKIEVVVDGQAAIEHFEQCIQDPVTRPLPGLVLLDIRMPRLSGLEFLAWWKNRPELSEVPIVMLSSSPEPHEIAEAYELGAVAYLVKPARAEDLRTLIKVLSGESPSTNLPGLKNPHDFPALADARRLRS